MQTLPIIRAFFAEFSTTLYDTGFGDVVVMSEIERATTETKMREALSFIAGAAYMARLGNEFLSTQWYICDLVTCGASVFLRHLSSVAMCQKLCNTYRAELLELMAKKRAA